MTFEFWQSVLKFFDILLANKMPFYIAITSGELTVSSHNNSLNVESSRPDLKDRLKLAPIFKEENAEMWSSKSRSNENRY
jgi:hypothetical protein